MSFLKYDFKTLAIFRLWGRRCDNLYSPTPLNTMSTRTGTPSSLLGWGSSWSRGDPGPAGDQAHWRTSQADDVYGFRYVRSKSGSQISQTGQTCPSLIICTLRWKLENCQIERRALDSSYNLRQSNKHETIQLCSVHSTTFT